MNKDKLKIIENKHPIQAYMDLFEAGKKDLLKSANEYMGTNYKVRHLDNWLSGRSTTPVKLKTFIRVEIMKKLIGVEAVNSLLPIL